MTTPERTPDRTEELIRAMLERRASQPMPPWLFDRAMHAIVVAPQARPGRSPARLPVSTAGRLALVAALALVLTLLGGGALLAAGLLRLPVLPAPAPTFPAGVVVPSGSPGAEPSPVASPSASPTPRITPKPAPKALAPNSMAVVTAAGDGLRVRSAPGTGSDSKKLSPLLPKGTRMLVVDGPVAADGMDWYQVKAAHDEGLFGWVSSGKDGEQWIKKTAPKCLETLDETAPWKVPAMDFLACYGDAPVTVRAIGWQEGGLDTGEGYFYCPWTGEEDYCALEPDWLATDRYFTYTDKGVPAGEGFAVVAPGADAGPGIGSPAQGVKLTLAMDAPEAAGCRVRDGRGRDVLAPEAAILACRLTFVVRDMEWEPTDPLLDVPSIATVTQDGLAVWDEVGGSPTGQTLPAGSSVLVVEGPEWDGLVGWYLVAPTDAPMGTAGWVPVVGAGGERTLATVAVDCPTGTDWAAIEALTPPERLACFGASEITTDVLVTQEPADPNRGLCTDFAASTGSDRRCVSLPGWLTTYSGIVATDPARSGAGIEIRLNPWQRGNDGFPSTEPTVVRVTGSFGHEGSWECSLRDAVTNALLVPDIDAYIACKQVFVVNEIRDAPGFAGTPVPATASP